MKIAVIGAGGVGGYFGAQLARSGNQVSFVARGKHFEALKQSGLVVKSPDEAFHIDLDLVSDRVSDIENVDLIILAVKAWQVRDIAATL